MGDNLFLYKTMKSEMICAPKGHESIAQGLPWVSCFMAIRPEGAAESRAVRCCWILEPAA